MSQGGHSEPLLLLALFSDFSVSPSPFGLDFGTLDFGLGLDNWPQSTVLVQLGTSRYISVHFGTFQYFENFLVL